MPISSQFNIGIETHLYDIIPQFKKAVEESRNSKAEVSESIDDNTRKDLIDKYTEKQYNDFGWVRVNGVLSYRENGDFRAK